MHEFVHERISARDGRPSIRHWRLYVAQFAGFTGDCLAATCKVTMDRDESVGVDFVKNACMPNTTTCDTSTNIFTRCDSSGKVAETLACPLGCNTSQPRCNDVNPSNGLATALDAYDALSAGQQVDVTLSDGATIDTTNRVVKTPSGTVVSIPSATITQTGGPAIFVLLVKSLQTGNVKVDGSRALGIVSAGDVAIEGIMQLDAHDDGFPVIRTEGPGSVTTCDASNGNVSGSQNSGGGGGGHGLNGAAGGASGSTLGGSPSNQQSDSTGVPLRGGCRGGAGPAQASAQTRGRGGGAVQIVSRTEIALASTGVVSANGTGGGGDVVTCGDAGGGGAGGTILLEAPGITVGSAAILAANGGGGGCSGNTGSPGARSATPASGCTASNGAGGTGGSGGAGMAGPTTGANHPTCAGGGGGAYGRIRINSAQTFSQGGATISPSASLGIVDKR